MLYTIEYVDANNGAANFNAETEIVAGKTGIDAAGGSVNFTGPVKVIGGEYAGLGGSAVKVAMLAHPVSYQYDSDWAEDPETHEWYPIMATATTDSGAINMDLHGQGAGNQITGSIIADQGGAINISNAKNMTIAGNVLAANTFATTNSTSAISIALEGPGSSLTGRLDDFRNFAAGSGRDTEWKGISANSIAAAGNIALSLKNGATWKASGDNYVTSLTMDHGIVDLSAAGRQSVDIASLSGAAGAFRVNLDAADAANSDIITIGSAAGGSYTVDIVNMDEVAAALKNSQSGGKVLLATTGDGNTSFQAAKSLEKGLYNYTYALEREPAQNPGGQMQALDAGQTYNWYMTNEITGQELSDAGLTVQQAAQSVYGNLVGLDSYRERLGEARYFDGEAGTWIRFSRSRSGQEDSYKTYSSKLQLGLDTKRETTAGGEHRTGLAVSHGDGSTSYHGLNGKGENDSYEAALYDSWQGSQGSYRDIVVKYSRYENSFDILGKATGNKISGDFANNAFAAGVEYGKSKRMGNGWRLEPSAQLQYARILSGDYVTSQNSQVELDRINSLIGRAGMKLAREAGKGSYYVKADVLHEFLGDQTIKAQDATGSMTEEYRNKGTWCNLGIGAAVAMNQSASFMVDLEKSFGNNLGDNWRANAAVRWAF